MDNQYLFGAGLLVGIVVSWLYAATSRGAIPTPEQMGTIVTQAALSVSRAAIIEGSGTEKAKTATEILGNALAGYGIKIDTKFLSVIVEAVYQYDKMSKQINQ